MWNERCYEEVNTFNSKMNILFASPFTCNNVVNHFALVKCACRKYSGIANTVDKNVCKRKIKL